MGVRRFMLDTLLRLKMSGNLKPRLKIKEIAIKNFKDFLFKNIIY